MKWTDPETWLVLIIALALLGGGVPAGLGVYRRSIRPPPRPRRLIRPWREAPPSLYPDTREKDADPERDRRTPVD